MSSSTTKAKFISTNLPFSQSFIMTSSKYKRSCTIQNYYKTKMHRLKKIFLIYALILTQIKIYIYIYSKCKKAHIICLNVVTNNCTTLKPYLKKNTNKKYIFKSIYSINIDFNNNHLPKFLRMGGSQSLRVIVSRATSTFGNGLYQKVSYYLGLALNGL